MRGELYLVTDRAACMGRPLEEVVKAALDAGLKWVQLREKEADSLDFFRRAETLRRIVEPYDGARLIINDRADVALAVGAHGLHIGQRDLPYLVARRLMGAGAIIGLSVETMEQVAQANAWQPDYIAASPVFNTPTKTDTAPAWGLEGMSRVRAASALPLVAIGAIHAGNAAAVRRAGADCIAVVSAICSSSDPGKATAKLLREVKSGEGIAC